MIEKWYTFLNWLIDYSILISAITSLLLTLLTCIVKIDLKAQRTLVIGIIILTVIFSLEFYIYQFIVWPFSMIPILGILMTFTIMLSDDNKLKKRFSRVSYFIICAFLLLAAELAKSSMNTWGSGAIYTGVFVIVYIIPLLQLLQLVYKQEKIYGIFKLATGISLLSIILLYGFTHSDYNGEEVDIIRNGVIILGVLFSLEGVVLLFHKQSVTIPIKTQGAEV